MPEKNKNENREGIKTVYSAEPHPNGYFDKFGLSEDLAGAVLELKLNNSNKTGTFSLINNPEIIRMIVNSDFANISERVLIKNYWKDADGNLRTNFKIIKEGEIELEGNKWVIKSPCVIEFLDNTDETLELSQEIGPKDVVQAKTKVLASDQQAENKAEALGGEKAKNELKDKLKPGEEEVAEVVAKVENNEDNFVEPKILGKAINILFKNGNWNDSVKLENGLNLTGQQQEVNKKIKQIEKELVRLGIIASKKQKGKTTEQIITGFYDLLIKDKTALEEKLENAQFNSEAITTILEEIQIEKVKDITEKVQEDNFEKVYIPRTKDNIQKYCSNKTDKDPIILTEEKLLELVYDLGIDRDTKIKLIKELVKQNVLKKIDDENYEIITVNQNQNESNPVTTVKVGQTVELGVGRNDRKFEIIEDPAPTVKTPKNNDQIETEYIAALGQNTIEGFQKFIDNNPTSLNLIADAQRKIDKLNNEIKKSEDLEQTKARLLEIVEQAREEWAKILKEKAKGDEGKLENAKKDWDDAKREYVKFLLETDPTNGKVLAQEFLLSQVEFKKDVEKSGWDKLKEKVSKGIKWWENVGNNPKDKKITRIVKKTIKATINVAIIGGAGAIVVSAAAALGIGSAAAISGSIASYVGQRMLNSSIISAATAILPPGLQQIASITLSVTSVAGATGLLVSKGVGLATKKLYSEEAIAKSTKEKKSNLENQIEVGLDEAKLAKIEGEIEKILKAEKNKRLARRVLAGASALATSVAVLEMSAPLTNLENTENNNVPEDRLNKSPYAQQVSQDTSNQEIENTNEDGNLNQSEEIGEERTQNQSEEIGEERTQNQNEEIEQTKFAIEENVKNNEGVTQTLKHLYEKESNQDNIPEWFKNAIGENYDKKDWAEFATKIGVYDAEAKLDSLVVHEGDKIAFDENENLILERNGESFVLAKPDDNDGFVKGDWQIEMQNEKFIDTDKYPNTGSTIERIRGDEIIESGRIEKLGYMDEDDENYQGEGHQYLDQEDSGYDRNEGSQEFDNMNLKEFFAIGEDNMSTEEVQKAEELRNLFNQAQAIDPDTKEWIRSHPELSIKGAEKVYKEIIAGSFDVPSQTQIENIGMTETQIQQQIIELTKDRHDEIVNDIFTKNRMFGKDIPGLESESWNEIKDTKINDLFRIYANDPRELDKDQREFVKTLHKINNNITTPGTENETVDEYLNRKLNDKSEEIVKQRNINTQNLKFGI